MSTGPSSVASAKRGLRRRGARYRYTERSGSRRETRHQSDQCAEHDECHTCPEPTYKRIEKGLDNRLAGVGIGSLIHHIQVPARNGMDGYHGLRLLAGQIDALFRRHLKLLLAVLIDIKQRVLGVVDRKS